MTTPDLNLAFSDGDSAADGVDVEMNEGDSEDDAETEDEADDTAFENRIHS